MSLEPGASVSALASAVVMGAASAMGIPAHNHKLMVNAVCLPQNLENFIFVKNTIVDKDIVVQLDGFCYDYFVTK